MFGFGSMSPFFHDEYLFGDDKRPPRRQRQDDDYCRQPCPVCGEPLKFRDDAKKIRCRHCESRFSVSDRVW